MNVKAALDLAGRIMLAAIFVIDSLQLVRFYEGSKGYMESFGVASALLPLVILVQICGGLAVAVGFLTRIAAVALAVFVLAAAYFFHTNLADVNQFNHFWKNVAIAGAFVLLAVNGPGAWSLDRQFPILGRKLHS